MSTLNEAPRARPGNVGRIGCVALALTASGISILMVAAMALKNGGDPAERTLWAAFGVVPVLAAHWLPTLSRAAGPTVRGVTWAMWAVCMAYATYSHASYFLLSQQEAGLRRSDSLVASVRRTAPMRALSVVLAEQAKARGELTRLAASTCQDCRWVRGRIEELRAKITALQAEAEETRRDQAAHDRADRLREEHRADPITSKLSAWLDLPSALVALAPALLFAVILDGLASLCWLLATQQRQEPPTKDSADPVATIAPASSTTAAIPVTLVTPVTPMAPITQVAVSNVGSAALLSPPTAGRVAAVPPRALDFDARVSSAEAAITAGQIRPTVNDIRQHLSCSQKLASAVRLAIMNRQDASGDANGAETPAAGWAA